MSDRSNNNGRGYEYACLHILQNHINKERPAIIVENSSYYAAENAWNMFTVGEQSLYKISAEAAIQSLFRLEPRIIEHGFTPVELYIQQDTNGVSGDVRDIIIQRQDISWQIGISVKHNHFAVKHSRLSPSIDFGESWYGYPCSRTYWKAVTPIFEYLRQAHAESIYFRDLLNKANDIYVPLLQAFMSEINRQYAKHKDLPKKLVEYLLCKYDFYKWISIDTHRITQLQAYNLHGTLNQASRIATPDIIIPKTALPKRIISFGFYPNRSNTLLLCMDNGWAFTFRIHNAEEICTPSLKFDVQIIGVPTTIISINCPWN